ncbi:hypothetical protein FHN55_10045 [Streptomyces sp. NP160]|uniref:hypothetical protein n=1 Tax=Streptomyces sp. NP160 TaxID=2586637 RepID=UPI001119EE9F|nr:hypothetical protein [Streptomyces sp. NP160]TNM67740.1 hypothetical protein FHN55_10045 [Streptomyces sp. NP160]
MIAAPRPTPGPLPGDLYLDPAVPDCERVTISRNGWSAQASHVWTGVGWTRLVPGVVHDVPAHPEVTLPGARSVPAPRSVAAAEGLDRWRRRRASLPQGAPAPAASRSVADAS